jgi:hypothetical protein
MIYICLGSFLSIIWVPSRDGDDRYGWTGIWSTLLDLLDIMMMLQPCIPSFKLGGQRRNNTEHGMVGDGEKKL